MWTPRLYVRVSVTKNQGLNRWPDLHDIRGNKLPSKRQFSDSRHRHRHASLSVRTAASILHRSDDIYALPRSKCQFRVNLLTAQQNVAPDRLEHNWVGKTSTKIYETFLTSVEIGTVNAVHKPTFRVHHKNGTSL
jgi:hypothetical protein